MARSEVAKSSDGGGGGNGRRRRWVYNKLSLCTLLTLQPVCLFLAFVLLTEPCLNAAFKPSLWDKRNYFTIIAALGQPAEAASVGSVLAVDRRVEWTERFGRAGVKSLFGTAVIQAWFTARITAYIHKAAVEEGRLLALLRQRTSAAVPHGRADASAKRVDGDQEALQAVGSFIRQMESVSATFLLLPFVTAGVYALLVTLGAPLGTHRKQTAVLAGHLTLLVCLPVVHVLGFPPVPELSTKSLDTVTPSVPASRSPPSPLPSPQVTARTTDTTTTKIPPGNTSPSFLNTDRSWASLLILRPHPSYLLPLFWPVLATTATTILSTASLALDWDKPWQTYPFPPLIASIAGLALGNVLTIYLVLFH